MAYDHTCMHEFVMSLEKFHKDSHVSALDVAKALLDYGIHPPTMYFPLIVDEALMVEPTETEAKEVLDEAIEAFIAIHKQMMESPESVMACPVTPPARRPAAERAAPHPTLPPTPE